ncbi:PRC and DUF2382 domain-containing protein [Streptomyces sp. NPDC003717]|uniref:PRC and DUF2382 domain-containing protein n=1 Tax=Streptomyces sp. NPDC003717 TaxID=3154276 RepID=UPI0033B960E3
MTTYLRSDELADLTVHDQAGEKIGLVDHVYCGDDSGRPTWVTVSTGLLGLKEAFIPLAGAQAVGEELRVPFSKDLIKSAPCADTDGLLTRAEERRLYDHYGLPHHELAGDAVGLSGTDPYDASPGAVESVVSDDGETMVRSEERLHVGAEEQVVGTARLRKVVVTEHVTTTIPVSHEEVRVVREPVRPGERVDAPMGEAQSEVTLHAERPVVVKEEVPVERVRLSTERVTEQREIHDTVRKEEIAFEDGTGSTPPA